MLAGGGPPVRVGGVAGAGAVPGSPAGGAAGVGALLGAGGVKGSKPGAAEAVVGELCTGVAGAETGTGALAGFDLCGVVEQPAPHITSAASRAGAQAPWLRVGCIYTPANTSITMYINILLEV